MVAQIGVGTIAFPEILIAGKENCKFTRQQKLSFSALPGDNLYNADITIIPRREIADDTPKQKTKSNQATNEGEEFGSQLFAQRHRGSISVA